MNIDNIREDHLSKGVGCNVCSGKKVLRGYNDLWTTHLEVAKLLKHLERGYKVNRGSDKLEIFICPDCGYEKSYVVSSIVNQGLSCLKCKDGISYPNKFAFNFLEQLDVNFTPEYSPDWIKPKRFDFYFELDNKKYILEMDGKLGHGNENKWQKGVESQAIDDFKDKLANEIDIKIIRIDCYYSDFEFIKNNLLNSKLSSIFDMSVIDWSKCHEFALSNRVKEACKLWHNLRNVKEISKIMKLHKTTVTRYLKQGVEIGWCDYDPREEIIRNGRICGENRGKPIIQLSIEGKYINKFNSMHDAGRQLDINYRNIHLCCKGDRKSAGGFKWRYEDIEYIKLPEAN